MKTLRAIHECEKSENKMVAIEVNGTGVTFCGYCHKPVPYNHFFKDVVEDKKKINKILAKDSFEEVKNFLD